jgi:hypothetical protein
MDRGLAGLISTRSGTTHLIHGFFFYKVQNEKHEI